MSEDFGGAGDMLGGMLGSLMGFEQASKYGAAYAVDEAEGRLAVARAELEVTLAQIVCLELKLEGETPDTPAHLLVQKRIAAARLLTDTERKLVEALEAQLEHAKRHALQSMGPSPLEGMGKLLGGLGIPVPDAGTPQAPPSGAIETDDGTITLDGVEPKPDPGDKPND